MIRVIYSVLVISLLAGCAASSQVVGEKLDPVTSATMTFSSTPMILYRHDPARAAHSKNFVSLGPLEVNRSGHYEYYMWLGIWNTNQTASVAERSAGFDSIVIFADGEPLQLELSGWTPASIGASEHVYPKPVASALDAYYQLTADQIRLIVQATDIELRTGSFAPRAFEPWDNQAAARAGFQQLLQRF